MTNKKFSELALTNSVNDTDIFALSQQQVGGIWSSRGVTGAVLKAGLVGPEGPPGIAGEPGKDGQPGKDGDPGTDGKSAYDIWLDAGNTGSEADFIASLKGEPGEGADITLSPVKDNLLKKEGDGLKVLASHPIIPKVYTSSYSTSKSAMARQSMPDGATVYRGTFDIKNPLGIKSLNSVGIFTSLSPQSGYFYLGKDNEFVTIQVYATPKTTTASTITVNLALVFSGEPYRAFDVYSGEEAVSSEEGDARISVSIRLIAGTTMGQNGFD